MSNQLEQDQERWEQDQRMTKQDAALSPVRSEPMLDDIRAEFRKHGWAFHMLTDAMLLDTVRSALNRYDEMQAAINGMIETVQKLRESNMTAQGCREAAYPEAAGSPLDSLQ